jgi:hypothetical protein
MRPRREGRPRELWGRGEAMAAAAEEGLAHIAARWSSACSTGHVFVVQPVSWSCQPQQYDCNTIVPSQWLGSLRSVSQTLLSIQ